ncbi:MAG TPA: hypothetical protein VFI39_11960 [Gemmatimonadales bacterium]|nr:hypothetical protein [Gemmatimonadales bacterium]
MNAVKNCLVVLAAAVALASCSADPNKSSAGQATLTVTPGSVAIRAGTTAEVFATAQDPLGGAVGGSFTISNPTPTLFTAVIDTGYTPVSGGGHVDTRTRIVVTALTAGDGSFTITGTGGAKTIAVRIAPDSLNGNITLSKSTLAEIDTFTATLPAGVRFTSGTTVGIYHQATSADSALFSPVLVGISADSETATVAVGPNSGGRVRFDGIANISTPTITYPVRGGTILSSPTLDTSGTDVTTPLVVHVTLNVTHPAVLDTVTATAPAGWLFTPATTVHLYKGPTVNDSSDGQAQPVIIGPSADSTTFKFLPGPSGHGQARFTHMVLKSNPAFAYAAVRSIDTLTVAALSTVGAVAYVRADSFPDTTVTVTLPAGFKFTPDSRATMPGKSSPITVGVAADSSSISLLLTPGTNAPVAFSGIVYHDFTGLAFTANNSVNVAAAVPDLGGDDPFAGPAIYSPTLGAGVLVGGFWDQLTFQNNGADNVIGDGDEQWYFITLTEAGDVTFTADWTGAGGDLDMFIVDGGFTSILSQDGATTAHPESATISPSAANTSYYVGITNSSGTVTGALGLQISIAP